ncbi:MAG: T9SS type A sorting domain-containing protein [Candidatus Zixiibacteriota bacterium]
MRRSFFMLLLIALLAASLFGQISRPVGAVDEGEPALGDDYNDTYNSGCNGGVAYNLPISSGDIFWGVSGYYDVGGTPTPDVDYYKVELTEAANITWIVAGDFDFVMSINEVDADDCPILPAEEELVVSASDTGVVSIDADAGTYLLRVECNDLPATSENYFAECRITNLEILSLTSDLININTDSDYPTHFANQGQTHEVEVTVRNNGHYASDDARVWLYNQNGTPLGSNLLGHLAPGASRTLDFTIVEFIAADVDTIFADFGEGDGSDDIMYAMGHEYTYDTLFVEVQEDAKILVEDVDIDPETCNNAPFVVAGQNFNLRITISNPGEGTIEDIAIVLQSTSSLGIESSFDSLTVFEDVNIAGGTTEALMIPIIADTEVGEDDALDEYFNISISGTDKNDGASINSGDIDYLDDEEWIGIQNPPQVEIDRYMTDAPYDEFWLNQNDPFTFEVAIANLAGDNTIAGDLDSMGASIELIGSTIAGIDGIDEHADVTVDQIGAGDEAIYRFDLMNSGATMNTIVDVAFTAHYSNMSYAPFTEATESPITMTFENAFGIDIIDPSVNFEGPSLTTTPRWPSDSTVKLRARDNFSGVHADSVFFEIINTDGEFWNEAMGAWMIFPPVKYNTEHTVEPDSAVLNRWTYKLDALPDVATDRFFIKAWAMDSAGNVSEKVNLPMGDYIHFVNIDFINSDLPKEMDDPETAGYEYEADYEHEHTVSLDIRNGTSVTFYDVGIELRSRYGDETVIIQAPVLDSLESMEEAVLEYDVTELPSSVIDSLYPVLVSGVDDIAPGAMPIGLTLREGSEFIRIKVEEPVVFSIESLWVDNSTAPNYRVDDPDFENGTYVTNGQQFDIKARVSITGEDKLDSVRIKLRNQQIDGSGVVSAILAPAEKMFRNWVADPIIRYDDDIVTWSIIADVDDIGNNGRAMDELFNCDIDFDDYGLLYMKADNRHYTELLVENQDDSDSIGVQKRPELDNVGNMIFEGSDEHTGVYWINANPDNYVTCMLNVENEDDGVTPDLDDRAIADRLLDYSELFGSIYLTDLADNPIEEIDGNERIESLTPDLGLEWAIAPLEVDEMQWTLRWNDDSDIYEGLAYTKCNIRYHDNNKMPDDPSTDDSLFYSIGSKIGIDITDANVIDARVSIPYTRPPAIKTHYDEFPEEILARVEDESHSVPLYIDKVQLKIVNERGRYWDGSSWVGDESWIPMTYEDVDTYKVALGAPDIQGRYDCTVRAYDIAGNDPDPDARFTFSFIYDTVCPETDITHPEAGFYSLTPELGNHWNRTIEIEANDQIPSIAGIDSVDISNVSVVYVTVHDTLRDKWWKHGFGWSTDVSFENECDYDEIGGVWKYNGFTGSLDPSVLEIESYAIDSAGNVCGYDSELRYLVLDNTAPELNIYGRSEIDTEGPATCALSCAEWATILDNAITGEVSDSILQIDSVLLSIENVDDERWWSDSEEGFTEATEYWFNPGSYSPHEEDDWSGIEEINEEDASVIGWHTLDFKYDMECPIPMGESAVLRVVAKAFDDVGNASVDTQYFCVDNEAPYASPVYPAELEAVHITETWADHDTFKVTVFDSLVGSCPCDDCVPEVEMRLTRASDNKIWIETMPGSGLWVDPPVDYEDLNLNLDPIADSNMWFYHHSLLPMSVGQYNITLRVTDCRNNVNTLYWTFMITNEERGFITLETPDVDGHYVRHVGEEFPLIATVYDRPGHVDSLFPWPLEFGTNIAPSVVSFPPPTVLSNGRDTFTVSVDQVGAMNFWAEVQEPGPDYDRAWTLPAITIIDTISSDFYRIAENVENDQGDSIRIRHVIVNEDAEYNYYYKNSAMEWVEIEPARVAGGTSIGDTVEAILYLGDMAGVDYVAAIEYGINVITDPGIPGYTDSTGVIAIDEAIAIDEYPPLAIDDLCIEWLDGTEQVRLEWDGVTDGLNPDDSTDIQPEFMPDDHIEYVIYHSEKPYSEYTVLDTTDETFFVDTETREELRNYYYYVVPADRDNIADDSYYHHDIVGKFDKVIGVDYGYPSVDRWVFNSLPFDVEDVENSYDFIDEYIYPNQNNIWTLDADLGWNQNQSIDSASGMAFPPVPIVFEEYTQGFLSYSSVEKTITLVGDVPDEGTIELDLSAGNFGNLMLVPLDKEGLTTAEELGDDLLAEGVDLDAISNTVSIARYVEDVGYIGPDFDVRPGDCYRVYINSPGSYSKEAMKDDKEEVHGFEIDGRVYADPCMIYGKADDTNWKIEGRMYGVSGNVVTGVVEDGYFHIQVGHFGEVWKTGDIVTIEFSDDDGNTFIRDIELTGEPTIDIGKITNDVTIEKPMEFSLLENNPNPFNASTKISFAIAEDCKTELSIYDIDGKLVKKLVDNELAAGEYNIRWNGLDERNNTVPTGVYFYKLQAGNYSNTKRMMLIK